MDVRLVLLFPEIPIAGTQNEIGFDPVVAVLANDSGRPDCVPNPTIGKNGTAFSFQPVGCEPGTTCTAIRSFVLSLTDTDPIPDGSVLYTCPIRVSEAAAPGSVLPLPCSFAGASDPDGRAISTICRDGEVHIVEESRNTPTTTPAAPTPTPSGPRLSNGTQCASDAECASGVCDVFDKICCERRCDPIWDFCDPSQCGICWPFSDDRPPDGPFPCASDRNCGTSAFCVEGVCCKAPECPEGHVCRLETGTCAPGLPNGAACEQPEECGSGYCVNNVCCFVPRCPRGSFCQPGTGLWCVGPTPRDRCDQDSDCPTGLCVNRVCCDAPE